MITNPAEIERESFSRIRNTPGYVWKDPETEPVLLRVLHATADFDYLENLWFSPGVVSAAKKALQGGCCIVCDTQMALAGISKPLLQQLGCSVRSFISEESVAAQAKSRGVTRACISMEHAARLNGPLIFAIGNAPTALMRLRELIDQRAVRPELVIAVPVGFVNVVESKELFLNREPPAIVARGRKGGSSVAAAIVNALLKLAVSVEN